jgi:hypothetical protein
MKTSFPVKVECDRQKDAVGYIVRIEMAAVDAQGNVSLFSEPQEQFFKTSHE